MSVGLPGGETASAATHDGPRAGATCSNARKGESSTAATSLSADAGEGMISFAAPKVDRRLRHGKIIVYLS